ncbi:HD-GYP domain-containing protein [Adhaeretor mobilis]|uniref:Cyclic di-GMP phosphodiesterase response regulator RpfG n=1 Tax=Adhaeretor mobilis TaxID=1930276 RepID=A0A517N0I5_9BACT|nr:HD domain-containing phosphohydrolase [Adhaeretor mobilis]QDT00650.1 Cyclic di-GMP phosphodiesterase response regulator RpfG [Adhaeretor mobilis]
MPIALKTQADAAQDASDDYVPIALDAYRLTQRQNVDVYCRLTGQNAYKLYAGRTRRIKEHDFAELQKRGHSTLYFDQHAFDAVSEELLGRLETILADENVATEQRFAVLQTAVAAEVDSAFRLTNCDKFVGLANKMGTQVASLLRGGNTVPSELFQIGQHDAYTFMHVTNVAGYAVVLAEHMGISDPAELEQIATGAILHDVGKRRVPAEILKTKGRLTTEQRAVIEDHPRFGYEELCARDDLSLAQLMMVYQHHEKIDGTGYPVRVGGDEIHQWAKLIAVVDVFDALTSKRPYRRPAALADVLGFLEEGSGTHFDSEMVRCWIDAFQQS